MGSTTQVQLGDHGDQSTGDGIEHVINNEGGSLECVLLPSDADGEALATQWVAASEKSYVPLSEME